MRVCDSRTYIALNLSCLGAKDTTQSLWETVSLLKKCCCHKTCCGRMGCAKVMGNIFVVTEVSTLLIITRVSSGLTLISIMRMSSVLLVSEFISVWSTWQKRSKKNDC